MIFFIASNNFQNTATKYLLYLAFVWLVFVFLSILWRSRRGSVCFLCCSLSFYCTLYYMYFEIKPLHYCTDKQLFLALNSHTRLYIDCALVYLILHFTIYPDTGRDIDRLNMFHDISYIKCIKFLYIKFFLIHCISCILHDP